MQHMLQSTPPDISFRIAERAEFVFLILKQIRVDRSGPNSVFLREALHFRYIVQPARQIP